jgi:glycosyltransferase involved in cell wall biosynthesis
METAAMQDYPLVSVVIPVLNGEAYLGAAIDSVLAQDYRPLEVVVIDNGSTDRTIDVVSGYPAPVRLYCELTPGAAAGRQRGVMESRGSFLAFLDADDLWMPKKLTSQIAALQADPGLDMVFGYVQQFHSPELDLQDRRPIFYGSEPAPGWTVPAMVIRREAMQRVPFTSEWRTGEVIDWYIRAMEEGLTAVMLPDLVLRRRLHLGNKSLHDHATRTDYVRFLKASLVRRRARTGHELRCTAG